MYYVCDILFNFAYLKMQPSNCVFMSILLMIANGLTVHGPSGPLVAPLGSSVVLPCYVDELLLMEDLEVEWRRTDSEALVHLFLNGESRAEVQQQDYHDRAHFFTDQIQHGNFSLLLDNLRAKDEGKYTCKVYSQQDSGETKVQIKYVERLLVSGSDVSISASVGEDVTLNCSVDSHIKPEHIEEVSWKKTDEDEDILVLPYQNNQTFPDSSDEQYRDRVEFFTDEISKGNFSLRLKSVRTEDKGVYMCEVFAGELSANATVVLERIGFSTFHIILLIFCIAAASGAILLLYSLMCCRSSNTVYSCTVWNLQKYSVIFPNICMFFAFIFWGLTEGFQNETITCCALHILRPFMLVKYHKDSLGSWTWIRISSLKKELAAFTALVFSVFFIDTWKKSAHDRNVLFHIIFGMLFGYVLLFCFILSRGFSRMHIKWIGLYFLSLAQFTLLITSQGLPSPGFLPVPIVHAVLLMCMPCKYLSRRWIILLWIITLPLLDIALVIYVHLCILEKLKDYLESICVIAFLEVLRIKVAFEDPDFVAESSGDQRRQQQTKMSQQGSNALHLCNKIMYMFGAVGLVLLSSATLTAELILKARDGERFVKDLRVIVFPSECVFALYWLVLQIHAFYLKN